VKSASIFFLTALGCALASAAFAGPGRGVDENRCGPEGGAVERKDDRFTGESTVTLKPQEIATGAPGQRLKVALEYKIKPRRGPGQSVIPEMVNVVFTSAAPARVYERDPELVFLIGGERVRPVPAAVHDDYSRLSTDKVLTQTVFTGMTEGTLRRISRAKEVEMKLGGTEVRLSQEVLSAFRSFAACALGGN
jgi:hypothetical protein